MQPNYWKTTLPEQDGTATLQRLFRPKQCLTPTITWQIPQHVAAPLWISVRIDISVMNKQLHKQLIGFNPLRCFITMKYCATLESNVEIWPHEISHFMTLSPYGVSYNEVIISNSKSFYQYPDNHSSFWKKWINREVDHWEQGQECCHFIGCHRRVNANVLVSSWWKVGVGNICSTHSSLLFVMYQLSLLLLRSGLVTTLSTRWYHRANFKSFNI